MTTVPQSRPKSRFRRPPIAAIVAAVLALAALLTFVVPRLTGSAADPLQGGTATPVTRADLTAGISATGQVEPRREAALSFTTTGRVAEVLVNEGDAVTAGQPLIQLESRQLQAELAQAQATLAEAQADLQALQDGATAEEIAAAEAQVAVARGNLQQTLGSVTAADVQAARASVEEARARLATLQGRPNADALATAQAALTQAQADLDRQRTALSVAKIDAERRVQDAANALRDAQTAFAFARDNLASVEADGDDPLTGAPLTDAGERQVANTFQNAQRAMQNAEAALSQARVDYQAAVQNEITGLRDAEARVASAQATLDALLSPNADTLAAARAQLASAEANLSRLLGDQRQGAVSAQEAALAQAEASLAQITADPTATDLARREAGVARAQAQVDLAQARLDEATLTAPFDGVIAAVNVTVGEQVGQDAPVTVIDISRYVVKVTVDEVDVARVQPGQPVEVLLDALGAPALPGTVLRISPQAVAGTEVTSYEVEVEVDPSGRPAKPGMTASATIVAERRTGVLTVPSEAIRQENGADVVSVVSGTGSQVTVETRPVQLGISDGAMVEVVGGLNEGERVVVPGT